MLDQARKSVKYFRTLMNEGKIAEHNRLVAEDFFAVFSIGSDRSIETYDAEQYTAGNKEAATQYEGKSPHWDYQDFASEMRFDDEIIFSSHIDFSLNGHHIMKAFCTEIYRLEGEDWKLVRQYMEKYRS